MFVIQFSRLQKGYHSTVFKKKKKKNLQLSTDQSKKILNYSYPLIFFVTHLHFLNRRP